MWSASHAFTAPRVVNGQIAPMGASTVGAAEGLADGLVDGSLVDADGSKGAEREAV